MWNPGRHWQRALVFHQIFYSKFHFSVQNVQRDCNDGWINTSQAHSKTRDLKHANSCASTLSRLGLRRKHIVVLILFRDSEHLVKVGERLGFSFTQKTNHCDKNIMWSCPIDVSRQQAAVCSTQASTFNTAENIGNLNDAEGSWPSPLYFWQVYRDQKWGTPGSLNGC